MIIILVLAVRMMISMKKLRYFGEQFEKGNSDEIVWEWERIPNLISSILTSIDSQSCSWWKVDFLKMIMEIWSKEFSSEIERELGERELEKLRKRRGGGGGVKVWFKWKKGGYVGFIWNERIVTHHYLVKYLFWRFFVASKVVFISTPLYNDNIEAV